MPVCVHTFTLTHAHMHCGGTDTGCGFGIRLLAKETDSSKLLSRTQRCSVHAPGTAGPLFQACPGHRDVSSRRVQTRSPRQVLCSLPGGPASLSSPIHGCHSQQVRVSGHGGFSWSVSGSRALTAFPTSDTLSLASGSVPSGFYDVPWV